LEEIDYGKNAIFVDLKHDFSVSKLYSEYAVEKAYSSEVVLENRTYVSLLMLSSKVLKNTLDLDFDKNYILNFPESLFEKPKKIIKYINAVDNDYLKTKIHLKIQYTDYKKYKKQINQLINQGFSICLELDDNYDMDFSCLLLFTYIFVNKSAKYYDIIINSSEDIKTTIITIGGE
jgi:hypothetical protein